MSNIKHWKEKDANISETGSLRYNKGKPEIHQVPTNTIRGIAEVFAYGEQKYSKLNWAKGNDYSVPYDSAMRHLMAYWDGQDNDEESGLNHLKHALANIAMLLYYHDNYSDLDDRPYKITESWDE